MLKMNKIKDKKILRKQAKKQAKNNKKQQKKQKITKKYRSNVTRLNYKL